MEKNSQEKKPVKKNPLDDIVLPTESKKAELLEPTRMIVMAKPKTGKTTVCALLPKALVINFEDEVQTTTGMIMYCDSFTKLKLILQKIQLSGKPYEFGIIDTVTKLEELAEIEGERIYMRTPQGKNWIIKDDKGKLSPLCGKAKYGRLLHLPNGSGYGFVTEAMKQIDKEIKKTFSKVIYIAHVKETQLSSESTGEMISTDINLTGKNKQIFAADAHAIAYAERIGNDFYFKFLPSSDLLSGCKVDRLDGKTILISHKNDNNVIETHWDEIYLSIKK